MEPLMIEFKNYKLLKNELFTFPQGSNLYFVIGSNGRGKTSFLTGLLDILEAKNTTPNPVTFGETEGEIKFDFIDDEGINYSAKFEFTDEKGTFTLSSLGMIPNKKVKEIRDFFDHHHIVAEEFIKMGNNKESRKKQRDIFLDLIPPEKKAELLTSEASYETKYKERTEKGKQLSTLQAALSTSLTKEDQELLKKEAELKVEQENINIKKEKALKLEGQKGILENKKQRLLDEVEMLNNHYGSSLLQEQIISLQDSITKLIEQKTSIERQFIDYLDAEEKQIGKVKEDLDKIVKNISELPVIEYDKEREKEIDMQLDHIKQVAARALLMKDNCTKIEIVQKEYDKIDKEVKDLAKTCQDILQANAVSIPNIKIHADGLYYFNGEQEVPFCEEQIGTAEIYYTTLQILLALNQKTPIIIMGRAESLDLKSLEKINQLAEEYKKKTGKKVSIIFDRVIPNDSTIQLVAYEDLTI